MTDKVAELTAKVQEQRQTISELAAQIEFYRGFMPAYPEVNTPPPGYWVMRDDDKWGFGYIVDGFLEEGGWDYDTREEAVAAANTHFDDFFKVKAE